MKSLLSILLFCLLCFGAFAQSSEQPEVPKRRGNQPIGEFLPQFPGGKDSLYAFIGRNLKYPIVGIENKIEGKVLCQFTVNENGVLSEVSVLKPFHEAFDKECIRLVQSMPNWIPGMQQEKPIAMRIVLPIQFRL